MKADNFDNQSCMKPEEIEARSFEIITSELAGHTFAPGTETVVKRVIHTTADFDYAQTLYFSDSAVEAGRAALRTGSAIVTDTQMAASGINKTACRALRCPVHCFIADEDVSIMAKATGCTRSWLVVDKAASECGDCIYVVGNAPTALLRLCELVKEKEVAPKLVVGVPVGFVNVVESKELLLESGVPCIVAQGRKGGSTVAAAIMNALLYMEYER